MFLEESISTCTSADMEYLIKNLVRKARRSPRLQLREKHQQTSKSINEGPLGYLELLPLELKFMLFRHLPVDQLSVLTITSKSMRNLVELYRNSEAAQSHILPHKFPDTHVSITGDLQKKYLDQFSKLGLLLKRSTCLYATKDRLKLAEQFLDKYLCNYHNDCDNPSNCVALMCYGKFLSTLIAGWDDKECMKMFETIGKNTSMDKRLESVVNQKPGLYCDVELKVRLFFRRVFLGQTENIEERAFWLNQILKPYAMVHQAKILYLLYGPVYSREVVWLDMCENTPSNKAQATSTFAELATAFKILYHYSKDWSEDAIISVMDELTNSPEDWLVENVANLLYFCGDTITLKVLNSKAINGRISELANIITSLCLVCTKQGQKLSRVLHIVTEVCRVMENSRDRLLFLNTIVDVFKEILQDIHDFEDDNGQDLQNMLEAQALFIREVFQMAFKGLMS